MATSIQPQFSGAHLALNQNLLRLSAGARNVHPTFRDIFDYDTPAVRDRLFTCKTISSCLQIASQREIDQLRKAAAEKARAECAAED